MKFRPTRPLAAHKIKVKPCYALSSTALVLVDMLWLPDDSSSHLDRLFSMPTFDSRQIHTIAERVLTAAGVSSADAEVVAIELRDANLVGHDSHGVIRLMQYVDQMEKGFIKPDGEFSVLRDEPSLAVVDGGFHFGQVVATKALEIGLIKARETGSATVVARNCNHVGRLGSYADTAARAGFCSMMCVNAPGPGGTAPFGGIERRLGTNPIAMSAPRGDVPIVLDMTTSATAEGKIRVALQKGEQLAEGLIIDCEGRPSCNPADLYGPPAGAILPLGGAMGFKGFGLSVMIDVFGGILSGSGIARTDLPPGANGLWMYFVDVERFLPRGEFDAQIKKYADYIKSAKRVPGCDEILLPGEIELRRRQVREQEGIPIPDGTWKLISELAAKLGVSLENL
ncbi:MAG: Ldh family oxidoreductase [Planctomycetaceae bacterium]